MKDDLEKQFHEQFAINNNAKSSNLIALLAAVVALFSGYGYVYANTKPQCCCYDGIFTIDVFIGVAFICLVLLYFLCRLCLSQGTTQRKDQAIVDLIREKAYASETDSENLPLRKYTADEKCCCDFVIDFFNLFYWLFLFFQPIIIVSAAYKLCQCGITWWWAPLIALIVPLYSLMNVAVSLRSTANSCGASKVKTMVRTKKRGSYVNYVFVFASNIADTTKSIRIDLCRLFILRRGSDSAPFLCGVVHFRLLNCINNYEF